jgi:hypothetical protein
MKRHTAQSILDFVLIFVVLASLAVGITRIWVWFNANMAGQQISYQKSREVAGNATVYSPGSYIDIGANATCPNCKYEPLDLTKEWVFKGTTPAEKIQVPTYASVESPTITQVNCQEKCLDQPECVYREGEEGKFNEKCACFVQCSCHNKIDGRVESLRQRAAQFNTSAGNLREKESEFRQKAAECDDWWETCWWSGGFGTIGKEYTRAADIMSNQANNLDAQAAALRSNATSMSGCCDISIIRDQQICIYKYTGSECHKKCVEDPSAVGQCVPEGDNEAGAFDTKCPCYKQCHCEKNVVPGWLNRWNEDIKKLFIDKFEAYWTIWNIGCVLEPSSCPGSPYNHYDNHKDMYCSAARYLCDCKSNSRSKSCKDLCCFTVQEQSCNDPWGCWNCQISVRLSDKSYSFSTYYYAIAQRNKHAGRGWGRDCDSPTTNCDLTGCTDPNNCQKCGLSTLRDYLQSNTAPLKPNTIAYLQDKIGLLAAKAHTLYYSNCCSQDDPDACIDETIKKFCDAKSEEYCASGKYGEGGCKAMCKSKYTEGTESYESCWNFCFAACKSDWQNSCMSQNERE